MNVAMIKFIKKLINGMRQPRYAALRCVYACRNMLPDVAYLKVIFMLKMGYWPNLQNPVTFSEKLQWLKLYNRKEEYRKLVDKSAVKEYVAAKIGQEYVIPTIAEYESIDDISLLDLPEKFVLKTTHGGGGGGVVVCTCREHLDWTSAKLRLSESLKSDIYENLKEWPYKGVPKRILVEKCLIEDNSSPALNDYKFYCFNGKVRLLKIDFDRFVEHRANFYDESGQPLGISLGLYPADYSRELPIPSNLVEMIKIAERLAGDIPFVRVDLYNKEGQIYFGEITFFPDSGLSRFVPDEWDRKLGEWLVL